MQVQTTTITTETMKAAGANFTVTTFEQTVNAFCDCCDNTASGAKQILENRGWSLSSNCQFCPECNF